MSSIVHSVIGLLGKIVAYLPNLLPFVFVFGILVFVHEFGHFAMCKLAGIRVETFSFGFGKRIFGIKRGGTDYRVSLIPIGGYVKFLGEEPSEPGTTLEPDNFMAKSVWKRFLVMVMGAILNILLAIGIFTIVNIAGVDVAAYLEEKPVIGLIDPGSPAQRADFRFGDEILRINGRPTANWQEVEKAIGTNAEKDLRIDIRREDREMSVQLKTEQDKNYRFEFGYAGFYGQILTQVEVVTPGSPADRGALKSKDIIRTINGEAVYSFNIIPTLEKYPEKEIEIGIFRNGALLSLRITPRREGTVGKIGAQLRACTVQKKYPFFVAVGKSVRDCTSIATEVMVLIKKIFSGQASASKNLGGPIEIANQTMMVSKLGFMKLLYFMGFLSLQLGVLNLFPFILLPIIVGGSWKILLLLLLPVDGTQIFILGILKIIRRDFTPKFKQILGQIQFLCFFALFAFLFLNDINRLLPHGLKSLLPF